MQPTDVYAVSVGTSTAAFEIQGVDGRARLKGVYVTGISAVSDTSGGKIELRNGTAVSDEVLFTFQNPICSQITGGHFIKFPGNGILFDSGIFVDAELDAGPITLLYQGGASS